MNRDALSSPTRLGFLSAAASTALTASLFRSAMAQPAQTNVLRNYTTGTRGIVVSHKLAHAVTFLDPATYAVLQHIDVALNPHELVLAPDMKRVYVSIYGTGYYGHVIKANHLIAVVNLASRQLEGYIDVAPLKGPHALMFDKAGLLWVSCEANAEVAIVDVAKRKVVGTVPTGSTGSHFMTMLPDGSRLFVSNKATKFVSVIDVAARKVIRRMPDTEGTDGLCTSIDGRHVFLNDLGKPVMYVVDAQSMTIVRSVRLRGQGGHAARVRVSLDSRWVVTSNYEESFVTIMPMSNLESQTTLAVKKGPMGFAFPPVPNRALVTNHDSGFITSLDLARGKILGVYPVPMGAETLTYF